MDGYCSFNFKMRASNYLAIIQVTYFTKPSRFASACRVKFPLGKTRRPGRQPASPRERGRSGRRTPIGVRGRNLNGQAARTVVSPGCRAGSILGILIALKYHFLRTKLYPLKSVFFRVSCIMRFQANLANTNP